MTDEKPTSDLHATCTSYDERAQLIAERDEARAEAERLRDRVRRAEDRLALELDRQIQREQNRLANLIEMRRLADESDYYVKDVVDLTKPVQSSTAT